MSEQSEWYYIWAGRVHGPVSWGTVEGLLAEGIASDRLLVARRGDQRWMSPEEGRQAQLVPPAGTSEQLPPTTGLPARARPASVLEGIGYWLSLGWEMLVPNIWAFVLACLLMWLIGMLTLGILAAPLALGIFVMGLRVYDGRPVRASDVFAGLSLFFPAWGLNLVLGVLIFAPVLLIVGAAAAAGYAVQQWEGAGIAAVIAWLCCVLPWLAYMIFVTIACLFCQPLIADRRAGVIESIGLSWQAVRPQFWGYLLMQLVFGLINSAGVQACYVGGLVTWPYVILVLVALYRDRFPARRSDQLSS